MRKSLSLVVVLAAAAPAGAWNNTGHMVAARLAWLKLGAAERSKAQAILRRHPHYDEFLAADRPEGFSEDEWVFLRAATWSDWVRSHHPAQYHHSSWHFINYPFVPPGCTHIDANDHQPARGQENIVQQLDMAARKVRKGDGEEQALSLCWLLHLGGDIHQPLHCVALFSAKFRDGDRGGNLTFMRLKSDGKKVKLHPMWDGLLGNSTSPGALGRIVQEVLTMLEENPDLIKDNIESHKTLESWAQESAAIAVKDTYLNGKLPIGAEEDDASTIPLAPADYAKNAGHVARVQIAKAGVRLADLLSSVLK
jgi:hypothetical protein